MWRFVRHDRQPSCCQDHATGAPVRACVAAIVAVAIIPLIAAECCSAAQPSTGNKPVVVTALPAGDLPEFKAIDAALKTHFASQADFLPGDLLFQSQITQAMDAVAAAGWDVSDADRKAIVDRALANDSFLAKELSSPTGRKFMRRIARHPGTYSRLDQLSTIAGGQQLIRDLIRQKDGDKLIEYLATTQGGQNLGRMAGNSRHGVNLNKPTGRIYTADDLFSALKTAHDRQSAKQLQIAK
jgi:hypothetical protein